MTDELTTPSLEQVKGRTMVLWANWARSSAEIEFANDPDFWKEQVAGLNEWIFRELVSYLTPEERTLHERTLGQWQEKDAIKYSWNQVTSMPMLWALHLIDDFPAWDEEPAIGFDLSDFESVAEWAPEATLRSYKEIEAEAMTTEACLWRLRTDVRSGREGDEYGRKLMGRAAELNGVPLAADGDLALSNGESYRTLSEDEVFEKIEFLVERLVALNWLTGYAEKWEHVTADTAVSWLWDPPAEA